MNTELKMNEKTEQLATDIIGKADDYSKEIEKMHGKKGFVWAQDEETSQLVVYTKGKYAKKLMAFLDTLDNEDEAEKYLDALRDIETHIRSTPEPVPHIIKTLKETLPEFND